MIALAALLVLGQTYYTPSEATAVFQEANAAYGRGDLAGARERYERLIDHGKSGADVLYNLGTVALAEGRIGEAVLNLERARRLTGPESDVDGNLALARSKQLDQVTGEFAEEPLASRLSDAVPLETVSWVFLGAWASGWLALTLARWERAPGRRALRGLGAAALIAVAFPAGLALAVEGYSAATQKEGVVVESTAPARELPAGDAKVSFEVHAGLKLRMLQRVGAFVRIRLPNGLEAWAPRAAVVEI